MTGPLRKTPPPFPPNLMLIDKSDLISFLKFAGFDIEIATCSKGNEDIIVSGFDDTKDIWTLELFPRCD